MERAGRQRLATVLVVGVTILAAGATWAAAQKAGGGGGKAGGIGSGSTEAIFVAEIVLLMVVGRLLGEVMLRIRQPAVIGQLLAGLLLGPSVLGLLWPSAEHLIFPHDPAQKSMIDAVSQLGILLLLLLTGMETDLALVKRARGAAMAISLTGIAIPFICGVGLGEVMPDSLLPPGVNRLVASLFLGTALSISSIKILVMVVREMNFMRRNLGQVIVASAIIDDSVGWVIIAITFGIAQHGSVDPVPLAITIGGVIAFLAFSYTIGRWLVFTAIRLVNDTFKSEFAVITAILVIMGVMALITNALGVHTVLGAFVAGVLIGESPILTAHIKEQLRGIVFALFMPVFFGYSGLTADLTIMKSPELVLFTLALVAIASVGKFGGAFLGGTLGGLSRKESLAVGCGMNARGSTEVIVATIGLSIGALSQNLYTMIVAMAIITTMAMPPMLRRALRALPISKAERERLEREELDERGFVSNLERLLLMVDDSNTGRFASHLAGLIAGGRGMPLTLVPLMAKAKNGQQNKEGEQAKKDAEPHARAIKEGAKEGAEAATEKNEDKPRKVEIVTETKPQAQREIAGDAKSKAFDMLFIGIAKSRTPGGAFTKKLTDLVADFEGPFAVLVTANGEAKLKEGSNILVPVSGSDVSRRGAEVAFAIARPKKASVMAIYVSSQAGVRKSRIPTMVRRNEAAVLKDITQLGERYETKVKTAIARNEIAQTPILKEAQKRHDLIVMGVNRRPGEALFFGNTAAALLEKWNGPILFVAS